MCDCKASRSELLRDMAEALQSIKEYYVDGYGNESNCSGMWNDVRLLLERYWEVSNV